jgi:uncharacterized protein
MRPSPPDVSGSDQIGCRASSVIGVPRVRAALPFLIAVLAGCGEQPPDPRGVDRDETLLSVSATGEAETRPDRAVFQAGVNSWAPSAAAASEANRETMAEVVAALRQAGVAEKDIQTRALSVQRVEYGDRRGQFQASNVVVVTVRDIARAGPAVTAVTEAGANILSGPDLRLSDPEKAANSAYGNAYRAARARAQAYADAAGLEIARVLSIRDAGGTQGSRYLPGAPPPPPIVRSGYPMPESVDAAAPGATVLAGQTTSQVAVQVDFALRPK